MNLDCQFFSKSLKVRRIRLFFGEVSKSLTLPGLSYAGATMLRV